MSEDEATIDVPLTLDEIRAILAPDVNYEPYIDGYGEPMDPSQIKAAWESAEAKLRKSASNLA